MNPSGVLLVEDDDAIASGLARVLDSQGYVVSRVGRGRAALAQAGEDVGLVVLDLGLPDMDGLDVCRALRAARPELGILILTARDQELDVVAGLDAGADDYLIKPFHLSELLARVAGRHRARAAPEGVRPAGAAGAQRRPRGDPRAIMREVWDTDWVGATKTLDTHILTLRQKLERPEAIAALRGVGYRFEDE